MLKVFIASLEFLQANRSYMSERQIEKLLEMAVENVDENEANLLIEIITFVERIDQIKGGN